MNRDILKKFLIFFSGSLFINILMYVFQLLMWRTLTVADYGNLNTLISIYTIINIPIFWLWFFLVKNISNFYNNSKFWELDFLKRNLYRKVLKYFSIYYFLVYIILLIFLDYMKISFFEIHIIILSSVSLLFFWWFQNIAYAEQKNGLYSLVWIIDIVSRIIFSFLFIYLWFLYLWAFSWFFIWNIIALIFAKIFYKRNYEFDESKNYDINFSELKRSFMPALFFWGFWLLMTNIDIILAKGILSSVDLWYYTALMIISKIIIFWLGIFTWFCVPYLSDYNKNKKIIISTYSLIVFATILGASIFYFWWEFIITILLWEKYLYIANYLHYGIIIWWIYVIINFIINHFFILWKNKYVYLGYLFVIILILNIYFNNNYNSFQLFLFSVLKSYFYSIIILSIFIFSDFFIKKIQIK